MLYEDLQTNNIVLLITSKEKYNESLKNIHSEISKFNIVGYITLNKPFMSIIQDLKNLNIDDSKFFFLDGITATVQTPPVVGNAVFVSSPNDLTDMSLGISSLYNEHGADMVFFNTISTIIVYQDIGSVIKFAHNIITKSRVLNKKIVLFALKEDSESLIKDLNMFVDKIIEV